MVGIGTWAAGGLHWGKVDDTEVIAALQRALDDGVTFIDTADAYGWGHAEELVAKALKGRRDEAFIGTKLGIRRGGFSLDPAYVPKACDASLKRLGTDRIDLYQIHWPGDPNTPIEDSWDAMCALVDAGKVRFIGVSNFEVADLSTCAKIRHVDSLQPHYSMLFRQAEAEAIPWCHQNGTGVVAYGSLAYGLLTGKYDQKARFPKSDWRSGSFGFEYYDQLFAPRAFEDNVARVARLREVAEGHDITIAQLAVAWLLRDDAVTSAICGAKRPAQIEETAGGADVRLSEGELTEIERALAPRPSQRRQAPPD